MNENTKETEENIPVNPEQAAEESTVETAPLIDSVNAPIDYEAKAAELNDKYLRLYSEFDNFRKRTIKEKSEIIRAGGEDIFKAIVIPTIDDFERAMKANETVTDANLIKEGFALIYHKLHLACTGKNLEAMNCTGNVFNADLMESITNIPAPTEDMKGKVVDEVEKGYKLGDKVIRFAKVVVGS